MTESKPKVLLLTSANPNEGPGRMIYEWQKVFNVANIEADIMLLNPVKGHDEFLHVNDDTLLEKIKYYYNKVIYCRWFFRFSENHCFFYRKEENPRVSVRKLLSKIKKPYDMVLVQFWQGMLTFSSIEAIYDKLHCQIHFLGVDYSHMSGGCHFIGNCGQYKTGCKNCTEVKPLWLNRFASHNVEYRKRVYEKVRPIVWGNTYMQSFYKQSYLLKDVRMETSGMTADLSDIKPVEPYALREELCIDSKYKWIIAFGCQGLNDPRKGMKYLLEALQIFYNRLDAEQRESILILTAGKVSKDVDDLIPFSAKHLGFVSYEILKKFYAVSDVFLSPSVNDAGPMMVNQALCCGTPVVSFEMGTALDCIKGQGTGYCAELRNSEDFAKGILSIYSQTISAKREMRYLCRKFAEDNYGYEAKAKRLVALYNKYK